MTLTDQVVKNIITRVIKSQDYRIEIVNLINAEFLQFAVEFFKKIANAKLNSEEITIDWYKNNRDWWQSQKAEIEANYAKQGQ